MVNIHPSTSVIGLGLYIHHIHLLTMIYITICFISFALYILLVHTICSVVCLHLSCVSSGLPVPTTTSTGTTTTPTGTTTTPTGTTTIPTGTPTTTPTDTGGLAPFPVVAVLAPVIVILLLLLLIAVFVIVFLVLFKRGE